MPILNCIMSACHDKVDLCVVQFSRVTLPGQLQLINMQYQQRRTCDCTGSMRYQKPRVGELSNISISIFIAEHIISALPSW